MSRPWSGLHLAVPQQRRGRPQPGSLVNWPCCPKGRRYQNNRWAHPAPFMRDARSSPLFWEAARKACVLRKEMPSEGSHGGIAAFPSFGLRIVLYPCGFSSLFDSVGSNTADGHKRSGHVIVPGEAFTVEGGPDDPQHQGAYRDQISKRSPERFLRRGGLALKISNFQPHV
jgi:hypothetical protein